LPLSAAMHPGVPPAVALCRGAMAGLN